jgi:uncharacterized protein YbjT (DUF2867 family)
MAEAAADLAEDFDRQHRRLVGLLEECPEACFRLRPWDDGRTLAAIAEHIAMTYCNAVDLVVAIINDQPVPDVSSGVIDRINEQFGAAFEGLSGRRALDDLEYHAGRIRDLLAGLTPQQMEMESPGPVWRGHRRRVRQLVFALTIAHTEEHLNTLEPLLEGLAEEPVDLPVLVAGANGKIGREVVFAVAARGRRVRAMVREANRAAVLEGKADEVVVGDYLDRASLRAALHGVSSALLVSPTAAEQFERETSFIEAAREAGLRRLVRISGAGAGHKVPVRLLRRHQEIDDVLTASGVPHVRIYPANFQDNLPDWVHGAASTGWFGTPIAPADRFFMVNVRDIAAVAATALTEGGHDGRSYMVAAPEVPSLLEVAECLSRLSGRNIGYRMVAPEEFTERMIGLGHDPLFAEEMTELQCNLGSLRIPSQPLLFGNPVGIDVISKIGGKSPILVADYLAGRLASLGLEPAIPV